MQLTGRLCSKGLDATERGPLSRCVRTMKAGWSGFVAGGMDGCNRRSFDCPTVGQCVQSRSEVVKYLNLDLLRILLQLLRWATCCTTVGVTRNPCVDVRPSCVAGLSVGTTSCFQRSQMNGQRGRVPSSVHTYSTYVSN